VDTPKPKRSKKTAEATPETPQSTGMSRVERIKTFLSDPLTHRVAGIFLLFCALFVLLAFISFLFSWEEDQDKMYAPIGELLGQPVQSTNNVLGKLGALLSDSLIHQAFGLGSFSIVFILFLFGWRGVSGQWLLPPIASLKKSFLLTLWTSLLLGYLFTDQWFTLGGVFGYQCNLWLVSAAGQVGTGLIHGLIGTLVGLLWVAPQLPKRGSSSELDESLEDEPSLESKEQESGGDSDNVATRHDRFSGPLKDPYAPSEWKKAREQKAKTLADGALELEVEKPTSAKSNEPVAKGIAFEVTPPEVVETPVDTQVAKAADPKSDDSVKNVGLLDEFETQKIVAVQQLLDEQGEYDPTLDLSSYEYPPIDLLDVRGSDTPTINNEELTQNKDRIIETLRNYSIDIERIKATIGPTVTLYEIVPAPGVRISKIKNLEDDIALSLSAMGIRIIAPIPGKGTIGIEVPNQKPEVVSMRSLIASEKFQKTEFDLPVALGKTISNEIFIADLAKMPHLLMAGATGQGKSVGLNALLVSLLYKKHPSQIKFVLVDPKKVELTLFTIIERHFLAKLPNSEESIITDTKKVVHTLNSLCIEMDNRYELLKDAQVRNLKEYNAKFISRRLNPKEGHRYLPYIVLIIDEFADLIMTAGKEVEMPIARLAQLARAIGIHLIIATQRPSVNIITGTIKANFPARIAFRVSSKVDSRTILDTGGADQLIGRGDMLLSTGSDLIRLQCAFVDTPEVEKLAQFIAQQRGYPGAYELPEYSGDETGETKEEVDLSQRDAYFLEAARMIVQHQQGSTSLIQRRLKLGYNRAGRIVDQLEAAGIIGPSEGSKARQVFFPTEQALEDFLREKGFL
jgi:S-DNA-T family DNA segregation ATPase FtsK/SpoIIIE